MVGLQWMLVAALVTMVTLSAAGRSGSWRRGNNRRVEAAVEKVVKGVKGRPKGQLYSWDQPLSGSGTVKVKAFVPEGQNVVFVSTSANSRARLLPSRNLYTFSETPGGENDKLVVTRVARFCLKRSTALTLEGIVQQASESETTGTSAPLAQVAVDGTGQLLDNDAVEDLFNLHPALRLFCKRARVLDVESSSTYEGATRNVQTLTFDEELSIKLRQATIKSRRKFN